jgi:hypothetical protein
MSVRDAAPRPFGVRWQAQRDTAFSCGRAKVSKAPSPLRSAGAIQIKRFGPGAAMFGFRLVAAHEVLFGFLRSCFVTFVLFCELFERCRPYRAFCEKERILQTSRCPKEKKERNAWSSAASRMECVGTTTLWLHCSKPVAKDFRTRSPIHRETKAATCLRTPKTQMRPGTRPTGSPIHCFTDY